MPSTTTPELVCVDQELVVEALALVEAAATVLGRREEAPLNEFFTEEAWGLSKKIFGRPEFGLNGTDPLEVEIEARAMDLTAAALEVEHEASSASDLIRAYRQHAVDMRAAGDVNVPFDNLMAANDA